MRTILLLCLTLWTLNVQAAQVDCSNDRGECSINIDSNTGEGWCSCLDCSPNLRFSIRGDNLSDPTIEECETMLEGECTENAIMQASDVCAADVLALCEDGLVECIDYPRDESLCKVVGCCEFVVRRGIEKSTAFWECAEGQPTCDEGWAACESLLEFEQGADKNLIDDGPKTGGCSALCGASFFGAALSFWRLLRRSRNQTV